MLHQYQYFAFFIWFALFLHLQFVFAARKSDSLLFAVRKSYLFSFFYKQKFTVVEEDQNIIQSISAVVGGYVF